jgi:hypothetical protein
MTGKQAQNFGIRTITGTALLALGSTVMIACVGIFTWRFAGTLNNSLGVCAGLGMASLHAFQALAFDHSLFFAIALRMLVLFSALTATLIGIALLRRRGTGVTVAGRRDASVLPKGDQ